METCTDRSWGTDAAFCHLRDYAIDLLLFRTTGLCPFLLSADRRRTIDLLFHRTTGTGLCPFLLSTDRRRIN
jgi:hypothetical protein